jgi:hypothetical protein
MLSEYGPEPDQFRHAARVIDRSSRRVAIFIDEQVSSALGRRVPVKVETANPVHTFRVAAPTSCAAWNRPSVWCATEGDVLEERIPARRLNAYLWSLGVPAVQV